MEVPFQADDANFYFLFRFVVRDLTTTVCSIEQFLEMSQQALLVGRW